MSFKPDGILRTKNGTRRNKNPDFFVCYIISFNPTNPSLLLPAIGVPKSEIENKKDGLNGCWVNVVQTVRTFICACGC
jgi:hypothetical protein